MIAWRGLLQAMPRSASVRESSVGIEAVISCTAS